MMSIYEYTADELMEVLVDLDAVFAQHEPLQPKMTRRCFTYTERGTDSGVEQVLTTEWAKPSHLYLGAAGSIRARMLSQLPPDFENDQDESIEKLMGYHAFDAEGIDRQFPEIFKSLDGHLKLHHDISMNQFQNVVSSRFNGKSRLIELANETINNARRMRLCSELEAEAEGKEASYEQDEDYGIF